MRELHYGTFPLLTSDIENQVRPSEQLALEILRQAQESRLVNVEARNSSRLFI